MFLDHDYAPDVLRRHKGYTEAKRVLKEKKISFQTPFPARLQVFCEGETGLYNMAEKATKDMVERGFQVLVIKPAESWLERMKRLTWQTSRAKTRHRLETRSGFKQTLQASRTSGIKSGLRN